MQAKLLRVLQEREVRRVGGEKTIKVDVRVVAATNRNLQAEVAAGRFREDLLFRLQVLVVQLPPLRERDGDLPVLVQHLLEKISKARGRPAPRIEPDVLELFAKYPWPGNIRQLENVLQRAIILSPTPTLALTEANFERSSSLRSRGYDTQAAYDKAAADKATARKRETE